MLAFQSTFAVMYKPVANLGGIAGALRILASVERLIAFQKLKITVKF